VALDIIRIDSNRATFRVHFVLGSPCASRFPPILLGCWVQIPTDKNAGWKSKCRVHRVETGVAVALFAHPQSEIDNLGKSPVGGAESAGGIEPRSFGWKRPRKSFVEGPFSSDNILSYMNNACLAQQPDGELHTLHPCKIAKRNNASMVFKILIAGRWQSSHQPFMGLLLEQSRKIIVYRASVSYV